MKSRLGASNKIMTFGTAVECRLRAAKESQASNAAGEELLVDSKSRCCSFGNAGLCGLAIQTWLTVGIVVFNFVTFNLCVWANVECWNVLLVHSGIDVTCLKKQGKDGELS